MLSYDGDVRDASGISLILKQLKERSKLMLIRKPIQKERWLLLACLIGLVAIWIINWKTLSPIMLSDSIKIILVFLLIFLPLPVLLYFFSNRKKSAKDPNWRIIHYLDNISRYAGWISFTGLVAAFALPAINPKWISAFQLLFYSLPVLTFVALFRAFLGAYIEPYVQEPEEEAGYSAD